MLICRTTILCYNGGILTPSNNVLSENLLIAQVIEKVNACCWTGMLITMFRQACYWTSFELDDTSLLHSWLFNVSSSHLHLRPKSSPLLTCQDLHYIWSLIFFMHVACPYSLTLFAFTVILLFDTLNRLWSHNNNVSPLTSPFYAQIFYIFLTTLSSFSRFGLGYVLQRIRSSGEARWMTLRDCIHFVGLLSPSLPWHVL